MLHVAPTTLCSLYIYSLELKFQALARIKIVQFINSQNACTNGLGIFVSFCVNVCPPSFDQFSQHNIFF